MVKINPNIRPPWAQHGPIQCVVSLPGQRQQLIDYINSPEFEGTVRVEFHKSLSTADEGRKK